MLKKLPLKVKIVEVGMRDGLQNEKEFIPTKEKVNLINMLSETGLRHIEITSFVSPKWIPQMADNVEVAGSINQNKKVVYDALVPNLKGLDSAKLAGLKEIAYFLSASESHSMKNINKSVEEALIEGEKVIKGALNARMKVRVYLSTVFGCPFDGPTNPSKVLDLCQKLLNMGVYEVSISDTTGVANPKQVTEVVKLLSKNLDVNKIAVHFHDTRGSGLANALAALDSGITTFDSSFGGLGGCPFAPGASGNIATEDLIYMLHSMGVKTGVNLDKLVAASRYAGKIIGRTLPSKYLQASNSQCDEVIA